jgi:hypothetical protein
MVAADVAFVGSIEGAYVVWRSCSDVLAFGPPRFPPTTEATNGRREALRRNTLGLRNLTPTEAGYPTCGNRIHPIDAF